MTITNYTSSSGAVAIPSTINVRGVDLPVISIGNSALSTSPGQQLPA